MKFETTGVVLAESSQLPDGVMISARLNPVGDGSPHISWNLQLSCSEEAADLPFLRRGKKIRVTITEE